ncbi:MAG: hypothetical protein JJE28_00085 [Actinomycetales bacterium]|nr:hypothetical protein [Actinomycetales bacterium]
MVAFVDESFNLEHGRSYYILAAAIVEATDLNETRRALVDFYGGQSLHASPMFANGEVHSLRKSIDLIAIQHDGLDIVVQRQIDPGDIDGQIARASCLKLILKKLHNEFGCRLFVLDASYSGAGNAANLETSSQLRHEGLLRRETQVIHTYPRLEPLLGMPDVTAWAYRQEFTGRSTTWLEPLRAQAQVYFVSEAPQAP